VYVSVVKVTPDSMKLMKLRMGIISRKDNLLPVNEGVTVQTATLSDTNIWRLYVADIFETSITYV
ncbi:hypothetical protein KU710_23225, partial [Salmonella enterica subsp. enterica serovar Give]|nr:hypothetical protein [Salmonella enterica subsp. enterica serovar Give]